MYGISPYGWFLRNYGDEKPVLCRKYLIYGFILNVSISVIRLGCAIGLFRESTNVRSAAVRVNNQILLILTASVFSTYLVTAITRLIRQRNFFKISLKLLSVGSFVNYREGTAFSNAVILLQVVLFVTYVLRYSLHWIMWTGFLHIWSGMWYCSMFCSSSVPVFRFHPPSSFYVVEFKVERSCDVQSEVRRYSSIKRSHGTRFLAKVIFRHFWSSWYPVSSGDAVWYIGAYWSFLLFTSLGLYRIEIRVHNIFPLFIVFFDIRSFIISSSFRFFTHTGWQFRSDSSCYSGVLLQFCVFSGRCYLHILH
jgi:hypothetical protein